MEEGRWENGIRGLGDGDRKRIEGWKMGEWGMEDKGKCRDGRMGD